MVFSDSTSNQGIVEQIRYLNRTDSTLWSTAKIVASVNNYLDDVAGYAIGADATFQWDDTNHTKLPIGTTNLVANQSDYSFLTDEQGNSIVTLTRIDILDPSGTYRQLELIDQTDIPFWGLDQALATPNLPTYYDKIADNIIRLYPKPATSVTAGLKFYFQRTPSYFVATDTTKSPGVSPLLHRGFVIAGAYDCALTLGLSNMGALADEREKEKQKMIQYFANRNNDDEKKMSMGSLGRRFR